ncbi:hypothetical protein F2Q70_00010717 [Brassica cretica]|uniref:Uncharacterized protein n=1 Tax=Brassica cretica TaxID=69181 RepID=A0A8S9M315_BRACR|nr:hypothetical protein F2Q70_00010717 [Brassica cretica]
MLLTTTSFFLSSLLPLLQTSYCSWFVPEILLFISDLELRRGGESDVGDAALHHHSTLESSQSTGDPHRYHMSRTKPPTPRSEQMRSPSTLACAPSVFFSTFSWGEKENVRIVFGRWQDVLGELDECGYDGIFFDTYGEYYEDLWEFHQNLPKLLKPDGVYSYFNGFCGSNAFFHVVYCNLVTLEIESLGFSTQLIPLPVKDCLGVEVWEGVKQKYWQLDTYYLPVCQFSE